MKDYYDESLWEKVICFPYRLSYAIEQLWEKIKSAIKRARKNYDDFDLYDVSSSFIERYIRILTEFKQKTCSFPFSMSEEEWDNILQEMIDHLKLMNEEDIVAILSKGMPEDYEVNYREVWRIQQLHKDEFFKLFSKYFYDLWW